MRHIIFYIGFLILLGSCKNSDMSKVNSELLGTWELDSLSIYSGRLIKADSEGREFVFKNDSSFIYKWWHYDVGNRQSGKYFIVHNPKRGLITLCFVSDLDIISDGDTRIIGTEPDMEIPENDTIREDMNFDIFSIDSNRLVLIDNSVMLEGEPHMIFNRIYIYKKIK